MSSYIDDVNQQIFDIHVTYLIYCYTMKHDIFELTCLKFFNRQNKFSASIHKWRVAIRQLDLAKHALYWHV